MYLLVGLGNIGKEYEMTRHNFGFLALDEIISDYEFSAQAKKFKSEIFSGIINQKKVIAIKPQTFMNRSGLAVREVMDFFKIDIANVIVFHDEIDLELGRVRVKVGGGHAGHNGLRSIDEVVGNGYMRVRLGVGRSAVAQMDVADHVLADFTLEEVLLVRKINERVADAVGELVEGRLDGFLNRVYS